MKNRDNMRRMEKQNQKPVNHVMENVKQWRREHGLPPVGVTKQEFNKHFNAVGDQLKVS